MADNLLPVPRALSSQRPQAHPPRGKPEMPGRPGNAESSDRLLKRILLTIIGLMVLVVALEVVFQAAIAPQMRLTRISLDSDLNLTQNSILSAAGVKLDDLYYSLDPRQIEQRLASLPIVQSVVVTTVFPDTLTIRLRSRQAIAIALLRLGDGEQRPVQIDDQGYVFEFGLPAGQETLPVLSGLEFRNFRLGLHLPPVIVPFLQDLRNLRSQSPALYQAFSEFKVQPVGGNQVEIVAYTINSPVGVRLNARLSEERGVYIVRTMDMLARTEGLNKIREIDFRTNNVVYTKGVD